MSSRPSTHDVSVVIPARNAEFTILNQLLALRGQSTHRDFEVVVSDNGSTDHTREVVLQWAALNPNVRLVEAFERRGVSHARNVGVRNSTGSKVLVCDADDLVSPVWVEEMCAMLDHAPHVAGSLETARLNPGPERGWRFPPQPGRLPRALNFLPYAQGCNVGFHREVFDLIGGWDEEFVDGCDDVDFSWRIQLAGKEIREAPKAVISYRFRTGAIATAKQGYRYARAEWRLYDKFANVGMSLPRLSSAAIDLMKYFAMCPKALFGPTIRGRWLYATSVSAGKFASAYQYRRLHRSRETKVAS